MQGLIETCASWFGFLGDIIGFAFDAMTMVLWGIWGALYVTIRNLVVWFADECWEGVKVGLAQGLVAMLDTLGVCPDVEAGDIMYWLEVANRIVPVAEALGWLEGYWSFRLAQWGWKAVRWLTPGS